MLARIKLWDRPKDADIALTSTEKRYEPFWLAKASRCTLYKRKTVYRIHIEHTHASAVELLGQKLNIDVKCELNLPALEDCERVVILSEYFDGLYRQTPEKMLVDFAGNFTSARSPTAANRTSSRRLSPRPRCCNKSRPN